MNIELIGFDYSLGGLLDARSSHLFRSDVMHALSMRSSELRSLALLYVFWTWFRRVPS